MTEVVAPVAGHVQPLADAPDPVFAQELVGSGVAIEPDDDSRVMVAPIAGRIAKIHPHACVVLGDGVGILVHLGIDTVGLKGETFTVLAADKETVSVGQPLIEWSPTAIRERGLSPLVLVCAMDTKPGTVTSPVTGQHVAAGDALFGL